MLTSVNDSSTSRQSLSCLFSRFRLCTLEQFSSELQVWECAETKWSARQHHIQEHQGLGAGEVNARLGTTTEQEFTC